MKIYVLVKSDIFNNLEEGEMILASNDLSKMEAELDLHNNIVGDEYSVYYVKEVKFI